MPVWPQATALYKGDRSRSWSQEDSAGFIVPPEGLESKTGSEGKGPYFSPGSSKQSRRF